MLPRRILVSAKAPLKKRQPRNKNEMTGASDQPAAPVRMSLTKSFRMPANPIAAATVIKTAQEIVNAFRSRFKPATSDQIASAIASGKKIRLPRIMGKRWASP